ncbi:hypothetical protein NBH00_09280 [Paraconexibacter antarcticus]|uniref:Uncharacterized protein n=1 Tax=Paraconexibacter antarcticus TaxID=2949664 RepID=A0ABY5DXY5_9ACTN|nr:hypothetical protein [Paraconexibacter antarcticus]UTI66385.1 hypothetical protein NBH00_09280 [Paraconexibacter antarcticus]
MADDETTTPPAETTQAPDPAPAAEAAPAPVDPAPAAEPAPADSVPAAEAPAAPAEAAAAPAAEGDAPAAPATEGGAPAAPAAEGDAPAPGDKPKRRRSRGGGSKVAKAWGVKAANVDGVPTTDLTPTGEGVPVGGQPRRQGGGGKGKGGGKRPDRGPRPPREKGPLPFDELREAARTIVEIHGKRTALKDAFGELAQKERDQLSEIVASDGDFRVRARAISAGSLSAGKIGKALAAQQIAIADVQDLWALTLSKEDAAERQSWIRNAKRRDEERAKKQAERRNSADRISKEDMAKARDGHVGAKVRMDPAILAAFGGGDATPAAETDAEREERKAKKAKKQQQSSVLDRLGY